ncbi:protein artichoke [Bombyx mori]|uniref:Uncharacterized protein n=1 Tax=Bombyx mori TaxID=7091 RepID=A0A8R2QQQ7_BOMMO|nr:protein artichoke [Bombyx mori]XP_037866448.1 protein artichoke [Bombyx mori]XP_037866449.1 protein artichoke [Bombyx mori]
MDTKTLSKISFTFLVIVVATSGQSICPSPETILPCICTNRTEDIQIWCTHSDLSQVSKGLQRIGESIGKPIDELIIENNYLPSMPGKIFQHVPVLRLMLRYNGLERLSAAWLETQEKNLVEIFIVENELRNFPADSLLKLQNLQAITIQSQSLKRIPIFKNLQKLRYISVQSENLHAINENTFENLPNLDKLFIQGSPLLRIVKENAFYNLPKLRRLEITNCGINIIHMRAFSLIPSLSELSLSNNMILDATMVGRATRDISTLSHLNLNHNIIDKLNEGAFVDQPMLENLFLANNNISIIHHGAFHRVPKLRIVDLNYNKIRQIHPESFLQHSGSGVEELTLIGNEIRHISEFRALLDALPRLKFLDLSDNLLQEIPRGALRGHPSLERLHLNKNSIKFIQTDSFVAMPSLRELHLSNNTLSDVNEGPFWDLPALKGLDLSYNYFQRLQPKLLYNLPALRRINFSHNQLKVVDPITFLEIPLLEYVNISGNALVSLHPATFRNLENLYELDASFNKLIEFVPGLPRGLEQLYLQRNQITSLPVTPSPDLDLPSLRSLDISNNGIQKIPFGSLKTLHNLRRLYMERNGLRQIDTSTFSDLERLEILDLSENQIMTIHPKSFSKLIYLKQVNLHGNTVENFDFMTVQENEKLSLLDLSKNKLNTLSPSIVNRALDIETLNISSNSLNELPSTLNLLSKLKILDGSNNHIKKFAGNTINNLQTLINIRLPNNKIHELRSASFKGLRDLEIIDLDNNNIEVMHQKAISDLPKLVSIYLGRNHVIDLPDLVFSNLPKLRVIELQGNRLQHISTRAFDNVPLVQYLNLSNNQITKIDGSGLKLLTSLEVLDLSFNKLTGITRSSFQYMEWLVELNLDNNLICHISDQPFDLMPRLKVLSLRHNKLRAVSETPFEKLRNNIAILDFDGNPLICNCAIIWLKSWLLESSSVGPKCADGTYVKGMPFTHSDCFNIHVSEDDSKLCFTHENEALLPNLATSQVFSSLDKIKDYASEIKNDYHPNKVHSRPLPEESDYFYDDYIDYPYNDTILSGINNAITELNGNRSKENLGMTPTLYAEMKNTSSTKPNLTTNEPSSSFTFFGMPLPPIDMNKLLNSGRKIDWPQKRIPYHGNNYQTSEPPKFETGGFSPMLPSTAGGFMPIPGPTVNLSHTISNTQSNVKYNKKAEIEKSVIAVATRPPLTILKNNTVHQKMKSEIHELQAYLDDHNRTQIAYNRIKNVEEEKTAPNNLSKYNLMESNLTLTQVTEKESLLITTDTSNDMSLQAWMESSTISYSSTLKSPMRKHIEKQPTALSAVLIPNNLELMRNHSKRPATITKVNMPHLEQHSTLYNYSPITNREGKTRFSEITNTVNTKKQQIDENDWYYQNYNKTDVDPYIAPGIHASKCTLVEFNNYLKIVTLLVVVII